MKTLALVLLAAMPFASEGQQLAPDQQAVVVALSAVRGDLPERGTIVLVTKDAHATTNEAMLARALAADAQPLSTVRHCADENGRWACRLRGAAGAFAVKRIESTATDRMRVVVQTITQMNADNSPPWLHYRTYAIDLVRKNGGAWAVSAKGLMSQS